MCKHKHCCVENCISGFSKTFLNMLSIKLIVNNIFYITKFKKLLKNLVSYSSFMDNTRFALFCALMSVTYKAILCFLRRHLKDDNKSAIIAGFFAGLWSFMDQQKRRLLYTVLLLSRTCEAMCYLAVSHRKVRPIPYL